MRIECESVCALVFRRTQEGIRYLILRRIPERGGFWQSVSGRVENGEAAEDGARREVREETGLEVRNVILLEKVNVFFKPGEEAVYLEPCFGIEVASGEIVLSGEHDAHHWADLAAALSLVPFRGVREAFQELDRRLFVQISSPDDELEENRARSPRPETDRGLADR